MNDIKTQHAIVRNIEVIGEATKKLSSDLTEANHDVNGSADITVLISDDGVLAGYSIMANNDSWSVEATFHNVGDDSF